MRYQFHFNEADLAVIISMLLVTLSFCCFWFLFVSPAFKQVCYKKYPGDKGIIRHILLLKYTGFIMLGVVTPGIFLAIFPGYNAGSLGLAYNPLTIYNTLAWIIGLGIPIVAVMWFVSRSKMINSVYPQIRVHEWDVLLMMRYSIAWALFMMGYEILFRGLLLFPLADRLGVWPAIAVNTIFYVGSHIPKGSHETFAAMLFGPLLCIITLQTGTVWAAAFIHIILAVSNSMLAIKFNPDFIVVRKRMNINNSQCEMGCRCHPCES